MRCNTSSCLQLIRIKNFAGNMFIFWPFAWSLTMAAYSATIPFAVFLKLLAIGFVAVGCIWNDVIDRHVDACIERTRLRPIACGRISVLQALLFMILHVAVMIYIIWDVNQLTWYIGIVSIFPLAGAYPFMKRITFWPQAWLGISINTGTVMAWAIALNKCPSSCRYLAAASWSWTIWYDTIYACQDKTEDSRVGVKSTALLFGSQIKLCLGFFGAMLLLSLVISGIQNSQSAWYFSISVLGGGIHLLWQVYDIDINNPASCLKIFNHNGFYYGAIVEIGLLIDYIFVLFTRTDRV
ncbi:4-hydroxybenzoate polyprenyl transferase [Cyathus striatus]|nr:4-hydroxybenzoate polyprenyl transferase [Cyathus striatus]